MKKIYNSLLIILMLIIDSIYLYNSITNQNGHRLATYLALPLVLLLPLLYEKIVKKPLKDELKVIYYSFIFIADALGCVVGLYEKIGWFDIFSHYLSGVVTACVGIIILNDWKIKEKPFQVIILCLAITCFVAVFWEIFEFSVDNIAGMNLQHSIDTGVRDTMEDMIAAIIGSISFLGIYFITATNGIFHKFLNNLTIK